MFLHTGIIQNSTRLCVPWGFELRCILPAMENEMENKMEHEIDLVYTGVYRPHAQVHVRYRLE